MSEVLGRLNRTIEAQGPDDLLVQARDALAQAYQTIAELHEKISTQELTQRTEFIHRGRLQEAMGELLKPTESGRYAEAGYNDHFNDGVSAVDVLIDDWNA